MKDIKGYEGLYAVTEDGKVWSYPNTSPGSRGRLRKKPGYFLRASPDILGYPAVHLGNGKAVKTFRVHRLVVEAFIPPVPGKTFVNHINAIKSDNRVENLEWCNQKENMRHAARMGLIQYTGNKPNIPNANARFNRSEVLEIRSKYPAKTLHQLGAEYEVNFRTIWDIVTHRHYANIS